MTPNRILGRSAGPRRQSGQMIVVFALCLIAIMAMAGLLIDGGRAWAERRQAQAAADTAALAGAVSLNATANLGMSDLAREAAADAKAAELAAANGFGAGNVGCDGLPLLNGGITVNWPPSPESAFFNDTQYIEVHTTRAMRTAFAGVVGQPCWLVTTRATAKIPGPHADCGMCAVTEHRGDGQDNVFAIDNTAFLRSDGPIVVNGPSINGTSCVPGVHFVDGLGVGHNDAVGQFSACGTAIHLYHTGGTPGDLSVLSAPSITVSGGWTSNNGTVAHAEFISPECVPTAASGLAKDPKMYTNFPLPASNFCIGADPLKDPLKPIDPPDALATPMPARGVGACPDDPNVRIPPGDVAHPGKMSLTQGSEGPGAQRIICPGLYPGGFSMFSGNGVPIHVTMVPGVYIMLGGGFKVSGTSSIFGDGVMIYNTSASSAYALPTLPWSGTVPVCNNPPSQCLPLTTSMTGPAGRNIEDPANYVMTVTSAVTPNPTGTITFYLGDDPIVGCEAMSVVAVGTKQAKATCSVTFHGFGTQWITAVYSGDNNYAAVKDDKKTLATPNAILGEEDVDICTGPACSASAPCGAWVAPTGGPCTVMLTAPHTGAAFAGMLIFQDRVSEHGLQIWPAKGLPACAGSGDPPTWMTDHTPAGNMAAPYPDPCGALGGMSGTIYSPHSRDDSLPGAGQWDSTIEIHAEGVTNLQIISGKINLIKNDNARFLFNPDLFAGGGGIQLVEYSSPLQGSPC